MAKNISNTITYVICVVLLGVSGAQSILAADLSLYPVSQSLELSDEKELVTEVGITNTTTAPITFKVEVYDFGNLDASGGIAFLGAQKNLQTQYQLAQWVDLNKNEVTVEPGESVPVEVTIRNSGDLSPGGHYGAVVFHSVSSDATLSNGIAVQQLLASLIFLNKVGGANPRLELQQAVNTQNFYHNPQIELHFRNSGNVHVVPRGYIELIDFFGRVVLRGVINEASSLVLPEAERTILVPLHPVRIAWFPGLFIAKVAYRFDGSDQYVVLEQKMMYVPLTFSYALGCCVMLGFGVPLIRRWYKNHKKTKPHD